MNVFIANIINNQAFLREDECWHCFKVLRKKIGDEIVVIDGFGKIFLGKINFINEKKCDVELIKDFKAVELSDTYIHLAIAPTKQIDRIEWMLEKAVEIGLNEITFLKCKNSERINLKTERIQKIIESAVKQSLRAHLPKVNNLVDFEDFIKLNEDFDNKFIAHCFDTDKNALKTFDFKNFKTLICIGPEGDFTENEVNLALKNNYKAISLGNTRLRTETAGLYAVQAIKILSE